jgi:hypothetical protein
MVNTNSTENLPTQDSENNMDDVNKEQTIFEGSEQGKKTETSTDEEKGKIGGLEETHLSFEDIKSIYGGFVVTVSELEALLPFKEMFEQDPSRRKPFDPSILAHLPELQSYYEKAIKSLAERAESSPEQEYAFIDERFNPRRVNNLSKAMWPARPFVDLPTRRKNFISIETSKTRQELGIDNEAVNYAKYLLGEDNYTQYVNQYNKIDPILREHKTQNTPVPEEVILQVYEFNRTTTKIYASLESKQE